MSRTSLRAVGELVAVVGVVLSLVFVGLELRENRIAATAAAYQEIGIAQASLWLGRAHDRELNDVIGRLAADSLDWSSVSGSDLALARSYAIGAVRLYETVFLQVEQGLLEEEAMEEVLGWDMIRRSRFYLNMWPHVEPFLSPRFREFLLAQGIIRN